MAQLEMFSFHNTVKASGAELRALEGRALALEDGILAWWRKRPGVCLTPLQVWDAFPDSCEVSVKRALTNLTARGRLVKMGDMVMERRGVKNHLWRLNNMSK